MGTGRRPGNMDSAAQINPEGFSFDEATHRYFIGPRVVPGIHELLRDNRLIGEFRGTTGRGESVHRACELHDKGVIDEYVIPDEAMPYLMAWEKFCTEFGFRPRRIEEPLYNTWLCYAGRIDREGTYLHKGTAFRNVVLEIKTVKAEWWHGVQLALQDMLLPRLPTGPRHRIVVELHKDATFHVEPFNDMNDFAIGQACVALFWLRRNKNCA